MTGVDRPAVFQLLGYPGVGKYTIACEIVRQLEEAAEDDDDGDEEELELPSTDALADEVERFLRDHGQT